ncbi:helix-turn-helix domain-containing protein, partial [Candidatus Kaiserbacteria bacterium]|nr:helix-turn-helix domain-containing protein [Candidatus Kaiserbacteria bacterium]
MSNDTFFDGIQFISTADAAHKTGFSRDYIYRLCKEGRLIGRRVGKSWYVDPRSLTTLLAELEEGHAKRRQELSRQRAEEYRLRNPFTETPQGKMLDGSRYISTGDAAKESGLTRDYIYRLCKDGKLHGKRVGRVWYVNEEKFQEFLLTKEYNFYRRREELSQTRSDEYQKKHTPISSETTPSKPTPSGYVPAYIPSLFTKLLNGSVTLAVALMLIFGTYAAVDPSYVIRVQQSIRQELSHVTDSYQQIATNTTSAQLVAAASSPSALWGSVSGTLASIAQGITSSFDRLVYSIMFPPGATDSTATVDTTSGMVSVKITPYQGAVRPVVQKVSESAIAPVVTKAPAPVAAPVATRTTTPVQQTVVNNTYPVIERIIEKQTLASAGGLTQEVLDQKLQILDNKLTAQILAHSNANSTAISQNYAVIAQSNAIHNLDNVTVGNPTITGGSISGTSIAATSLSISGSATTTSGGGFDISSGCFSVNGTCVTGTGGSGTVTSITAGAGLSGGVITTSGTLALDYASSSIWTAASSTYTGHLSLNTASSSIFTSTTLCLTGDTCRTTWPTGGGGAWSWNIATNYGTSTNATTTPTWFQMGLFASSTSQCVNASSSQQTIASTLWLPAITSALLSTNASGQVVATTSIGTNLLTGILAIGNGGTGTSSAPTYGRLLMGNSSGTYDLVSTSSLGINSAVWGSITGTLSNQTDLQNALDAKLSLTSWYATTTDGLDEGGTNRYFTDARVQTYLDTVNKGFFFSTTSADHWKTQTTFTGASTTLLANNNTWTGLNTFGNSTTSLATISGTTWF